MQTDNRDEARREAAAANLERRRQELRGGRKKRIRRTTGGTKKNTGRNTRKKKGIIRKWNSLGAVRQKQIMLGLIIAALVILLVACTIRVRNYTEIREGSQSSQPDIVIGLKGSEVQIVLEGEPYIENGAFAIDRRSGALSSSEIKIRGKVKTKKPGEYRITYKVKHDGKSASAVRTVRVVSESEYGNKASDVPVLMYHWVYSDSYYPDSIDGNWILDTDLETQLEYLKKNEYYYPGWKELRAWIDGEISLPQKSTILTFDDGRDAFLKYGIPVLEKYKIPATSFMIGWDKNNGADKIRNYPSPYIDYESHTYAMHQQADPPVTGHKGIMAAMTEEQIKEDLAKAAELTGSNDALAYPYGDYTDAMLNAVRESGILCAFTTEYDRVRQGADPARLPRIRVLGDESFQTWKESLR